MGWNEQSKMRKAGEHEYAVTKVDISVEDSPAEVVEELEPIAQQPSAQKYLDRSPVRDWLRTRPFWGGCLLAIAGLLVIVGTLNIQVLAFSSSIFLEAWLVGALLILMGFLSIIAPSQALMAGSIGIVLSLASVLVAFGGYGIGVFLGLIGGSQCVAWRVGSARPSSKRHANPWRSRAQVKLQQSKLMKHLFKSVKE